MKNNALICYKKKCHAMNDKPNVMIALNEVKIHLSAELKGFSVPVLP